MTTRKTPVERLKTLKAATGLSWPAMCRAFGIGAGTLNNWLYGGAGMSATSGRLLDVFEGNHSELAKWAEAPVKRKPRGRARRQVARAAAAPERIPFPDRPTRRAENVENDC